MSVVDRGEINDLSRTDLQGLHDKSNRPVCGGAEAAQRFDQVWRVSLHWAEDEAVIEDVLIDTDK